MVDLDRIDFLFEIGGFPFDLDIIADFEGRRDFDDRDGDLIKNVGDLTEDLWAFWLGRFSYRFLLRQFNFLLYGRFFRAFFDFLFHGPPHYFQWNNSIPIFIFKFNRAFKCAVKQ